RSIQPFYNNDHRLKKLYLTGGGIRNRFILKALVRLMPTCSIESIEKLKLHPALLEASAFAVMGEACLRSDPMPGAYRKEREALWPVSGRIIQPPQQAAR
ncbi:MAG: anhydro-N-acetylmuramic acid kinase, partial [candidate division Zixibacteria bacterium]